MRIHKQLFLTVSFLFFVFFTITDDSFAQSPSKPLIPVPVYRLLDSHGYHFYTADQAEKNNAVSNLGFKYEGILGYVFSDRVMGTIPLYRFNGALGTYDDKFTAQSSVYYLTTDPNDELVTGDGRIHTANDGTTMMQDKLKPEGILGYISSEEIDGTTPIFNLSQHKADDFEYDDQKIHPAVFDQLLTNDEDEKSEAQKIYGYSDEGILGYIWNTPETR